FLYRVTPGVAEKSYGVYAAKLAGLPRPVVRRAEELLGEYEAGHVGAGREEAEPLDELESAAWAHASRLARELLDTDVNSLSPVEALMKLFELRKMAEGEKNLKALKTA
ncbi:MAG TPA: hypothetical protein VD968_16400, partial [Pyrinomonadaceae bacterium]|nr:hypothetical protein [Pyrinomonadaceae bacterium]